MIGSETHDHCGTLSALWLSLLRVCDKQAESLDLEGHALRSARSHIQLVCMCEARRVHHVLPIAYTAFVQVQNNECKLLTQPLPGESSLEDKD